MSRLKELIDELCPDGVEFKPLWSLTTWDKKFNAVDRAKQPKTISYPYFLANELFALQQDDGDVFLLSTGEKTGWTTEERAGKNLCEGEVVTIPWGKSRNVVDVMKYYKGKFVTADNRIATSNDTEVLSNKFLFYWMQSQGDVIDSFYRGSGIRHPSMKNVLDMQIPVPPMEVQSEIVRILDNFSEKSTELCELLSAEMIARKKQYEYYREKLLTFGADVPRIRLGEIGKICMCKRIMKNETNLIGGIPFYKIGTFGKEPDAYISEELFEEYRNKFSYPKKGDILISASGTIGRTVVFDGKPSYFQDSNIVWVDNDEKLITNKFLRHIYQITKWKTEGGTIKRLYNEILANVEIPLAPLTEQKRIADILDRFDSLCNDLTSGIPAEIAARKKQYEYYRDRLLTFREKNF